MCLQLLWLVTYGGTSWITSLHDYHVRLHFDAELEIPFVPAAAIVYLSLFPLLWMSVFVIPTTEQLRQFARGLAAMFVIAGVVFLVLPGQTVRDPIAEPGVIGAVYRLADQVNLSHNYLPSLHVAMAVFCAKFYSRKLRLKSKFAFWLWASAIAISTLLIHEHYVVDVLTGAALGYALAKQSTKAAPVDAI